MILSNILNIFEHSIIKVYGTKSQVFLSSTDVMAVFTDLF